MPRGICAAQGCRTFVWARGARTAARGGRGSLCEARAERGVGGGGGTRDAVVARVARAGGGCAGQDGCVHRTVVFTGPRTLCGNRRLVQGGWNVGRRRRRFPVMCKATRREKHPQDARLKLINSTKSGYEEGRAAGARAAGEADSRLKTVRRTSVQSVLETSTAYYQPSPLGFERRNVGVTKSPSVV
eukprot:scaffold8590_cov85-Isochrysis_galbana.AAC.2